MQLEVPRADSSKDCVVIRGRSFQGSARPVQRTKFACFTWHHAGRLAAQSQNLLEKGEFIGRPKMK